MSAEQKTSNAQRSTLNAEGRIGAMPFEITSIVCLAHCTDNKWRAVRLDNKSARKMFVYLDGMCDHRINVLMHPVKVILDRTRKNIFQHLIGRFKLRRSAPKTLLKPQP